MAVCALARNAPEQVFGDYPGNTCFKLFFATDYTDFHEFSCFFCVRELQENSSPKQILDTAHNTAKK